MKKYYFNVEIRAHFGVLAESQEEAVELAHKLVPLKDVPPGVMVSHDACLTRNQSANHRQYAVNKEAA